MPSSRLVSWCVLPCALLLLSACRQRTAEDYYRKGMQYQEKKDYRHAWVEFRNAIQKNPDLGPAHYQLAVSAEGIGDHRTSYNSLIEAERLDKGNSELSIPIRLRLAKILLTFKDYQEARRRAQWVLQRDQNNAAARELLAFALGGMAQPKLAAQELDQLLVEHPNNFQARMFRAFLHMVDAENDEARQMLEEGVTATHRSPQALIALANFYQVSDEARKAEPLYLEAIRTDPKNMGARSGLAWLYLRLRDRPKAEGMFRELGNLFPKDPEAAGALANYYVYVGDRDAAIKELERVTKISHDPLNANRLATLYYLAGRKEDTKKMVEELLAANSQDVQARLLNGILQLREGRYKEAIADFTHVTHYRSDLAAAYYFLGVATEAARDTQMAQQNMQTALKLNPSLLAARVWLAEANLMKDSGSAALDILHDLPFGQDKLPVVRMLRLLAYLTDKKLPSAREELRTLLVEDPRLVLGYYRTGLARILDQHSDLIRPAVEADLKEHPGSIELLSLLVRTLVTEGKIEQALARVEEQVRANPNSTPLLILQGDLQIQTGKYGAARASYSKAGSLRPDSSDPILGLAQVEFAEGNYPQARQHLENLLARNRNSSAGWFRLAVIKELQNDLRGATAGYEKALALDKQNALAANNLAWRLAYDGGDTNRALALAQMAHDLQPENPVVADTMGWVYYKMGSWHFAQGQFEEAVRRRPNSATYHYHLGLVQSRMGRNKEALDNLEAALHTNPQIKEAEEIRKKVAELKEKLGNN